MAEHETMRTMRAGDVPAAFQLPARAGWNQTEEDWRTLLELASQTCLVIEVYGQLAATTTLLCRGRCRYFDLRLMLNGSANKNACVPRRL